MIIIKMGGLTLLCIVQAYILDLPIKPSHEQKTEIKQALQRPSRLLLDEDVLAERIAFAERKRETYKMLDAKYDGWITMDKLLENKKDE